VAFSITSRGGRVILPIDDFRSGTSTEQHFSLPLTFTAASLNVISEGRKLAKRAGRLAINGTAIAGTPRGNGIMGFLPVFENTILPQTLVAQFGGTIYKMDESDGTWDSLTSGRVNDTVEMLNYYVGDTKHALIFSWSNEQPRRWDGDAAATSIMDTSAPRAAHATVWRNRCFTCGIDAEPFTIRYTNEDSLVFPSANSITVTADVQERLTGWGLLRTLYVFMPHSIHRITYLGGSPLYEVTQVVSGVGTMSPLTIKTIRVGGESAIVFLGSDRRVYLFNGFEVEAISNVIEEDNGIAEATLSSINSGGLKRCHAIVDESKSRYYLSFPNAGVQDMTHTYVLDYGPKGNDRASSLAWYLYSNQTFANASVAYDSDGGRRLVAVDYAGKAHYLEEGATDDGTAVTAKWQSPWFDFGASSVIAKVDEIRCFFRRLGNQTVNVYTRENFRQPWSVAQTASLSSEGDDFLNTFTLGTDILGGNVIASSTILPARTFNQLQIRLEDSLSTRPWVLERLEVLGKMTEGGMTVSAGEGTGA